MASSYKHSETTELSKTGISSFFGKIVNALKSLFSYNRKAKSIDHLKYYDHAQVHAAKLRQKLHKANASIQMPMYLK